MYGLELQTTTKSDLQKIEQFQRSHCRRFQALPDRTTLVAVYVLIGAEPIEATIDKYCINLLL